MKQACHIKHDNTFFILRRHHYNAIWVVGELRRFIRSAVKKEEMAAYIKQEFFGQLEPHLKDEEMALFPLLPPDNALRLQAEDQHTALHRLAENCISPAKVSLSIVEAFADLLEENIRFEERMLFPYMEKMANKENADLN